MEETGRPMGARSIRRAGAIRPRTGLRSEVGPGALLAVIRESGGLTRRDLIDMTGFARATVESRLDALLGSGLIVERARQGGSGGRPPKVFSFNEQAGYLLSVVLGSSHTRIGVSDLGCRTVALEDLDVDMSAGPGVVLGAVGTRLRRMLEQRGIEPRTVLGVGVGVPSPVELGGRMARPPERGGLSDLGGQWADVVIAREIMAFLPGLGVEAVPVVVDKDANIMALGEWRTTWPDVRDLIVFKVGITLACGIVANACVVRGVGGIAGDLGHVPDPASDVRCRCGQSGCAEAVASGEAIRRALGERGRGLKRGRDIVELLHAGDPEVAEHVVRAGRHIGRVIGDAISTLNPELVVVGGTLAEDNPLLIDSIRSVAASRVHPLAAASTQIVASTIKEDTGVIGAALLALEEALDPVVVDAMVGAGRSAG
ncbi:Sugar kinase of the NBD/HSP70 family, may contain an N-terminal HTH domain [Austwickia chelonae]|uniref:NagC family transcriptional regulator n=1 Tax=Austwickia chelonae NBRC 105200 TaxID=1184607 RepID=K6W529_9MICO|nr:ROK family transcriptional regulator [Austwickia chelonae]GAB76937.1 hypothetical protein AUCHE_03_01550 [Austwickia chelonae NBRC 105200]SEW32541.1 Sugar kinase of the NBD/HSP70 family, may contain an N-terminal HTH domain [Austwickia chelonae]